MAKRRERKEFEMLWRGARSFGSEADVFTSNWPTGAAAAAARAQGATACQLRCCHPGRTCCKQCQTWGGSLIAPPACAYSRTPILLSTGRSSARIHARTNACQPAAYRLAGCSQAGGLLAGWQAAHRLAGCSGRAARAGWPAARRLAGCSQAGRLLTGAGARRHVRPAHLLQLGLGLPGRAHPGRRVPGRVQRGRTHGRLREGLPRAGQRHARQRHHAHHGHRLPVLQRVCLVRRGAAPWPAARSLGRGASGGRDRGLGMLSGAATGGACGWPTWWKLRLGRLFSRCRRLVPLYLKYASRR